MNPTKFGFDNEILCQCGREAERQHCPRCGSLSYHGIVRTDTITITEPNGLLTQKEFQVYRCRKCSQVYNDWEWRNKCEAPNVNRFKSRSRVDEVSRELKNAIWSGDMTRRKAALAEMLQKYDPGLVQKHLGTKDLSKPKGEDVTLVRVEESETPKTKD